MAPSPASAPSGGDPFVGVHPFPPAAHDVFFGRSKDVSALCEMICQRDYRTGVLLGEAGVGKTSCVQAGLIGKLQAAGLHPIYIKCRRDLKKELTERAMDAGATPSMPDEELADYVVRLGRSLQGGLMLILDDLSDLLDDAAGEQVARPLLHLVSRLAVDESARARVLFCVDSDSYHHIAALQKQARVVLPPANIYTLHRLHKQDCTEIIEQTALASGTYFEAGLAALMAQDLTAQGPVLPLILQITVCRAIEKKTLFARSYLRQGGSALLTLDWLKTRCREAGGKNAVAMLSEIASSREHGTGWQTARTLGQATGLAEEKTVKLLDKLKSAGLIETQTHGAVTHHRLAQRGLLPLVRQIDGDLRAGRTRARLTLRKRLTAGGFLRPAELAAAMGHPPQSVEEAGLLKKSRRIYGATGGALILLVMVGWILLHWNAFGGYHLDVSDASTVNQTVVVRRGNPSTLSWTVVDPSPSLGGVLVDSGLSVQSLAPNALAKVEALRYSGDLDARKQGWPAWFAQLLTIAKKLCRAKLLLLLGEQKRAWKLLDAKSITPAQQSAILELIGLAGEGSKAEKAFVQPLLKAKNVALRAQALKAALCVEAKHPHRYLSLIKPLAADPSAKVRMVLLKSFARLPPSEALDLCKKLLVKATTAEHAHIVDLAARHRTAFPQAAAAILATVALRAEGAVGRRAVALLRTIFRNHPRKAGSALSTRLQKTKEPDRRRTILAWLQSFEPTALPTAELGKTLLKIAKVPPLETATPAVELAARLAPVKKTLSMLDTLAQKKGKKNQAWRALAARGFGILQQRNAKFDPATLRALAKDRRARVRRAAIRAIGRGVEGQAVLLMEAVSDRDLEVRAEALVAMAATTDKNPYKMLTTVRKLLRGTNNTTLKIARVRAAAALTTSRRYWAIARFEVVRATRRRDDEIRRAAVQALATIGHLRPKRTLRALKKRLDDKNAAVQRAVVTALSKLGPLRPQPVVEMLVTLLEKAQPAVRLAAAEALAALVAKATHRAPDSKAANSKGKKSGRKAQSRKEKTQKDEKKKSKKHKRQKNGTQPTLADAQLKTIGKGAVRCLQKARKEKLIRVCLQLLAALPVAARPVKLAAALSKSAQHSSDPATHRALLRTARTLNLPAVAAAVFAQGPVEIRLAALSLIQKKTPTNSGKVILAALDHPDPRVQRAGLQTAWYVDLAKHVKLQTRLARIALNPTHPLAAQALRIVCATPPKKQKDAIDQAVARLARAPRVAHRVKAAQAMAAAPHRFVRVLTGLLSDPAMEVRRQAIFGLAKQLAATQPPKKLLLRLHRQQAHRQQRFSAAVALWLKRADNKNKEQTNGVLKHCAKSKKHTRPLGRLLCRAAATAAPPPQNTIRAHLLPRDVEVLKLIESVLML